ncbi:UNVERIFIED_CONTAM: hypothetical protein K2H54_002079 [Gekko kuhli]
MGAAADARGHADVRKSTQKALDPRKDVLTRLKHLRALMAPPHPSCQRDPEKERMQKTLEKADEAKERCDQQCSL